LRGWRRNSATPGVTTPLILTAAGGTDIGLVRRTNEDSFAVLSERGLFMVADGVGGQPGGDVASRMAVDIVQKCMQEPGCNNEAGLAHGICTANQRIYERGRTDLQVWRMSTTFAGVLVTGSRVLLAHVGDSRIYRLRGGDLAQLTRDHTLGEDIRRHGGLYLESMSDLNPHLARRLTRALGSELEVEVETRVEQVRPGDVLLVCSDGLWSPVPEAEIADALSWKAGAPAIVRELIVRTMRYGAPDNVTCVVVRFAAG
jgi:serine/threonine protein phosphatase PrpC